MSSSTVRKDDGACPTFETCLEELQQIVSDLEDGTLGLEESMRRFEKGITLLRSCYTTLEQAEQKIQILTGLDANGNPQTAPFDATATIEQTKKSAGKRSTKKPPVNDASTLEANAPETDDGKTLF
jgi:exodeoxyribonuclease VII small subunit